MKKTLISEDDIITSEWIMEILEIYANAGIPENEILTAMTAAVTPGREGPLIRHSIWQRLPTELRIAYTKVVATIAEKAWKWRFEQDEDLLFAQRLKSQGIDYIRPTIEITRYLNRLLGERKQVTITKPTDFPPYKVTVRAFGYEDRTVLYGSILLASMALGIQLGSGSSPKPDEVLLYVN